MKDYLRKKLKTSDLVLDSQLKNFLFNENYCSTRELSNFLYCKPFFHHPQSYGVMMIKSARVGAHFEMFLVNLKESWNWVN